LIYSSYDSSKACANIVFSRRFQLMEMCWHTAPGQRASLRELRIMLLHLRSAVRENPSADFDQKWNQLMPRRIVIRSTSAAISCLSTCTRPHLTPLTLTWAPLSGSARPVSFESDFSELNASVTAQAGSLQPSVWSQSAAATPDSTGVVASDGGLPDSYVISSPVNEMSLAAELGVFDTTFGRPDDREGIDAKLSWRW
jgi:hypothetical protein